MRESDGQVKRGGFEGVSGVEGSSLSYNAEPEPRSRRARAGHSRARGARHSTGGTSRRHATLGAMSSADVGDGAEAVTAEGIPLRAPISTPPVPQQPAVARGNDVEGAPEMEPEPAMGCEGVPRSPARAVRNSAGREITQLQALMSEEETMALRRGVSAPLAKAAGRGRFVSEVHSHGTGTAAAAAAETATGAAANKKKLDIERVKMVRDARCGKWFW